MSINKTIEIDLKSMVKKTVRPHSNISLSYEEGFMIMKAGENDGDACMMTQQQFTVPIKIELRAKTDKTDINLEFAQICIAYNHDKVRNKYFIMDNANGNHKFAALTETPKVNEFVDIEWIIEKETMIVKVNGQIQYQSSDNKYVQMYKENPEYNFSSEITINTYNGSTLTVESLRIADMN